MATLGMRRAFVKFLHGKSARKANYEIRDTPNRLFSNHATRSAGSGRKTGSKIAISVGLLAVAALAKKEADKRQKIPSVKGSTETKEDKSIEVIIEECRDLVQRVKDENGCPGIVVGVSVDGKVVWSEGLGYADLENRTPCSPETVMRIASISKPITMAIVAKLMEAGKLDLDKPVQEYVPFWPKKSVKGEEVTITTRHLVSHLSGVRHYDKTCQKHRKFRNARQAAMKSNIKEVSTKSNSTDRSDTDVSVVESTSKPSSNSASAESQLHLNNTSNASTGRRGDSVFQEFYMKRHFDSTKEALDLFKDDELCSKPGSEYLYTTHGWTLVSAVAEGTSGLNFPALTKQLFKDLEMESTYLDESEPLIYNRSRFYVKSKAGRVVNAPYVDLSCKWAGGGMVSSVGDLMRFGNVMLYSYQYTSGMPLPSYLKPSTVKTLWTPVAGTVCDWDTDGHYGMGWGVVPEQKDNGKAGEQPVYISHTGGAIGASSVLLILPRKVVPSDATEGLPQGVIVAMFTNLPSVGLNKNALAIAKRFEKIHS